MSESKFSPAEEDLKHKRKEQFEKDPSQFIHVDDILLAAIKTDKGIAIAHGACHRHEMELALTRLNYRTFSLFNQMDMAAMLKQKENEIITAPGNGEIIT